MKKVLLFVSTFVLIVVGIAVIALDLPGPPWVVFAIEVMRRSDKHVTVINIEAAKLIALVVVLIAVPLFVRAISLVRKGEDGVKHTA